MIAEFLNRDVVLGQLRDMRDDLASQIERAARRGEAPPADAAVLDDLQSAVTREEADPSGPRGYEGPPAERRRDEAAPLEDYAFISHDPLISLAQSALDEHSAVEHAATELLSAPPPDDERRSETDVVAVSDQRLRQGLPERTDDGRRIFNKFSITDIRWARSKIAEGLRWFRDKRPFNETPAEPVALPGRARVLLVGDWGSGLPRARNVGKEMARVLARGVADRLTQHVIHLGDVYYSGWGHEYNRRFLPHWPVAPGQAEQIGSWCLNGNHDMYSGGYGLFDVLLADPRFASQRRSTCFTLVHPKWKILGLDTAWTNGGLCDPQPQWIEDELRDRSRHHLLLSHHQLFSAYEGVKPGVPEVMLPLLQRFPAKAWYWGHEHRCITYRPHQGVEYGRCIGHGGVPVYMWHKENDPYPEPAQYELRRFIRKGLEHWALFGFVVLDFYPDGLLTETFIDENGNEHGTVARLA